MSVRAARRGIAAASRVKTPALTTLSRNFADGVKPVGIIDLALTVGAGASIVSGVTLSEGSRVSGSGGLGSAAVMPDIMASNYFWSQVTVGGLSSAANDRGVGPGIFNSDGSRGVYTRWPSQSGTAVIETVVDGVVGAADTLGSQVASTGVRIRLVPVLSGGVVTWTVYKNDVLVSGLEWTDSGHLIDLPGLRPGVVFRRQYSGGTNYGSRGVTLVEAGVI